MKIRAGNTVSLEVACNDQDGTLLTTLATTTEVVMQLKTNKDDTTPALELTKTGAAITIDDPSEGYITVAITSANTQDLEGQYYIAAELRWSDATEEMKLVDAQGVEFETIIIEPDIVQPAA